MSARDDRSILDAYEAWDPTQKPLTQFLTEVGLARQSLYNVLNRNGVVPKSFRRAQLPEQGAAEVDLGELLRMSEWFLEGLVDRKVFDETVQRLRRRWPNV